MFSSARVAAVALINGLKAHPQAAAIQTFITQANTKLATADGHAAKSEWPQAMQALEDVKAIAATAKKAADDRQAFTVKLADVTMGMNAFQDFNAAHLQPAEHRHRQRQRPGGGQQLRRGQRDARCCSGPAADRG